MENNEILMEEEETSVLTLTDENGEEMEVYYLDCIEYNGKEYLALNPSDEENVIVFLEVEPVDEENENYLTVLDEEVLDAVYNIFKERYSDVMDFED